HHKKIKQDTILAAVSGATSILTGEAWLNELLNGHSQHFQEQLGMTKYVFRKLLQELQTHSGLEDRKHITAAEQLAIFLYLGCAGASNRDLQEWFQHNGDTISKYIHLLLEKCCGSFYQKFVCPPLDQTPYEIHSNPKLYPYFKDTHCSVDSSQFN
ncbi:transposon en spm sub-class, partial [Moniliophthora roreri MCA 2997]